MIKIQKKYKTIQELGQEKVLEKSRKDIKFLNNITKSINQVPLICNNGSKGCKTAQ